MFVRCKMRRKDGKEHRYWSVVENVRVRGGWVVQRQVLYLGEINDSQRAAWCRSIAVLDETAGARQLALSSADGSNPAISGHRKPGHIRRPETGVEFYLMGSCSRKDESCPMRSEPEGRIDSNVR